MAVASPKLQAFEVSPRSGGRQFINGLIALVTPETPTRPFGMSAFWSFLVEKNLVPTACLFPEGSTYVRCPLCSWSCGGAINRLFWPVVSISGWFTVKCSWHPTVNPCSYLTKGQSIGKFGHGEKTIDFIAPERCAETPVWLS